MKKRDPISAYNAGLFLCPIEQGEWLYFDITFYKPHTVKLGNKERFDKDLIGIKEPFSVTNLPFTS
jgi:hypothetical protein